MPTFSVHLDNIHDQSPTKRRRFECLKEAELDELEDGAKAKSTKYMRQVTLHVYIIR